MILSELVGPETFRQQRAWYFRVYNFSFGALA